VIHTLGTDWSRVAVETTMTDETVSAVTSFVYLVTSVAKRQLQHCCSTNTHTDAFGHYRPTNQTDRPRLLLIHDFIRSSEDNGDGLGPCICSLFTAGIVSSDARRMLTNLIQQFLQSPSSRNRYWSFFLPTSMTDVIHHTASCHLCVFGMSISFHVAA